MNDNVFADQLARTTSERAIDRYMSILRARYPRAVNFTFNAGDNHAQRIGIDVWVHMPNGDVMGVDIKERARPEYTFANTPDVNLEFKHVFPGDRTEPGWIEKEQRIQELIYVWYGGIHRSFDWHDLQAAWFANKAEWLRLTKLPKLERRGFFLSEAPNTTRAGGLKYVTLGCCVPIRELNRAIWAITGNTPTKDQRLDAPVEAQNTARTA